MCLFDLLAGGVRTPLSVIVDRSTFLELRPRPRALRLCEMIDGQEDSESKESAKFEANGKYQLSFQSLKNEEEGEFGSHDGRNAWNIEAAPWVPEEKCQAEDVISAVKGSESEAELEGMEGNGVLPIVDMLLAALDREMQETEVKEEATDSSTVSPVASSGHQLVYARPLDPKENEALKNAVDARPLDPKDDKNLEPAVEALEARPFDPKDDTNLEADDEILEMTRRCTPLPIFARLVRGLSCEVVTDWVMGGNLKRLTDVQAWRTTDSLECIGNLGIVELHGDMVMEVIDRCTDCCTRVTTVGCLADAAITVLARHWAPECSRFQNFRDHYDEILDALVRNLLLLISEAT